MKLQQGCANSSTHQLALAKEVYLKSLLPQVVLQSTGNTRISLERGSLFGQCFKDGCPKTLFKGLVAD